MKASLGAMLAVLLLSGACATAQPLLDYVNAPDDSYSWELEEEPSRTMGATLVKMRMVSQTWQGIPWDHHLWVMVPSGAEDAKTALLVVTGGDPSNDYIALGSAVAAQAKMPVAVLWNIPKQPLYDGRSEDRLIAYTFVHFLETGDQTWPLLFPMAKAAVRAMDTIQEYTSAEMGMGVEGFVVSGASKRGWTTWMTAASDDRVVGIAPMVYDNLNLVDQMKNQVACYEGYSEQIQEYTDYDLQAMLTSPEGKALADAVDPFSFRENLTMPKLIINGSNDPYWTLESPKFYFHDLPGQNSLLYAPNAGHDLGGIDMALSRIVPTVVTFVRHCEGQAEWPELSWTFEETAEGLTLTVNSTIKPQLAYAWVAESEDMDFRDETWSQATIQENDGALVFTLPKPEAGQNAVFGEFAYEIDGRRVTLSTEPRIQHAAEADAAETAP